MAEDWNITIIDEFRDNNGMVGGQFEGAPVLLLTTTGAKTGRARTSPMMYLLDGDHPVVFASAAGAPKNPAWYHNLLANPEVTVEIGCEVYPALAEPVAGPGRDALYARQVERYPGFGDYQAKTDRIIPVVTLTRLAAEN